MNKQEKQKKPHRHGQQYGGYQREGGRKVKGKGGQVHIDGRRFDLGCWVHNATYRSYTVETYIISLTNVALINLI